MNYYYYPDYLEHHGILGQKWGVRRYQNEDGSYTKEGLDRRKNGVPKGIGINRFTNKKGEVSAEGREHYARRPGRFSKNTSDRAKQLAKFGAISSGIGSAIGLGIGMSMVVASGAPAVAAGTAFCTGLLTGTLQTAGGAVDGYIYGAIAGAIETKAGRSYIARMDRD